MIYVLFIISLLLAGFFMGIETSLITTNKLSVELKKKQGNRKGLVLGEYLQNGMAFVGNSFAGFTICMVAYSLLATQVFDPLLKWMGVASWDSYEVSGMLIEILLATFLLLFVVFVFRLFFRRRNETLLYFFHKPIDFLFSLINPIRVINMRVAQWLLKYIFNVKVENMENPYGRIDMDHYFHQTRSTEEESERPNMELIENTLSLSGMKIRNSLVPRKEIVAVELESPVKDLVATMIETKLSRVVVYQHNIDNIVGYVHQLDTFKRPSKISEILLSIPTVPETMTVTDLINKLTQEHKSIAWVVDEFGGTAGIITMEDLLEEIFGEIRDEYDTDEFVEQRLSENEFVFSGRLETDYLEETYFLDLDKEFSETLSGYIIRNNNEMPKEGEKLVIGNIQFEVLNKSDTRIELVKLKKLE